MGRARAAVLFAVLALAASIPRFGQRENDASALSDSDYYLDMAAAAAGKGAFDPEWSSPGYFGAHHYSRPLLPYLAGTLARVVPVRAAFSLLDVVAAWTAAFVFFVFLRRTAPGLRHPWLPPALFLTGFPQVNWGYHILTDTVGLATAFCTAVAAWTMLERDDGAPKPLALLGLFALQSVAFLARETGWMVPIAVGWLLLGRRRRGQPVGPVVAVVAVLVLAALPHAMYLRAMGLRRIHIPLDAAAWMAPGYLLDFAVKSAVAFNLSWLLAGLGARGPRRPVVPEPLVGWSLAALAYMAAGYAHNSLAGIGYPLRLTWALFPAVLYLASWPLERIVDARRARAVAALLVAVNAAVALTGTLLDRGESGVTVPALMERARSPER